MTRAAQSIALLIFALSLGASAASADDISDFYRGKTITLIVTNPPGGGYDLLARTMAPFVSKYMPGNPNVIVQNMPGAGGIRGTNHLFNVAPKDGTVIGGISNTVSFE